MRRDLSEAETPAPGARARTYHSVARNYLFLQSHPSFFGREIVREMRAQGHLCHVVNLYLGDWFFRQGLNATNYTGTLEDWPAFLRQMIDDEHVTDIIYYADQRPYHRAARRIAMDANIHCYAYEFGYIRPDFITLERGGMGVFSHFPNDPDLIESLADKIPNSDPKGYYPYTFRDEAINEVFYHLIPWLLPISFRNYVRDRMYSPLSEYLSYLPKIAMKGLRSRRANGLINRLRDAQTRYHVVILQMQGDYQVRRAGHYADLSEMVDEILHSFSNHSDTRRQLIFKLHPLENALTNWPRLVRRIAQRLGVENRVHIIDGGDLKDLYDGSDGVVLLNSTAGLTALMEGLPVKVLGIAVYDMARMTHQGPLDTFWETPERPVPRTVSAFRKLLIAAIQVKGNFFTREGRERAIKEFVRRLVERDVNSHGAFIDPPPRLAKAREMGVPMIYET